MAGLTITGPSLALASPSLECSGDNSSQVEIGDCLASAEKQVQGAIDLALSFARDSAAELDEVTGRATSVKALEAGHSAWLQYRDAHCEFVGTTFGGGSGTGIAIQSCRINRGRVRTTELMDAVE